MGDDGNAEQRKCEMAKKCLARARLSDRSEALLPALLDVSNDLVRSGSQWPCCALFVQMHAVPQTIDSEEIFLDVV